MARQVTRHPILYDAKGQPLFAESGWDAASQKRRGRFWQPTSANINALLSGDVEIVRRRARDEVRKNPWGGKALRSSVSNLVGTGITPIWNTENDELKAAIQDAWAEWCEESDADGTQDFYGQQALATRAVLEGGECFVRFRERRPEDGMSVPLQLQLLEAEMVPSSKNESREDGSVIRAGIEFSPIGKRTVYWMYRTHPGEFTKPRGVPVLPVPVPASEVLHVFEVLRPGQIRGVPGLATVLTMLHEIREVQDAAVQRAKIQNLYATFETIPNPQEGSVLDGVTGLAADDDDEEVPTTTAAAGSHVLLPQGHDIKFAQPPEGASDLEVFVRDHLRAIAAGAGVLYEQISGNLQGVTFSSIRAGLIELRRELEQIQHRMIIFQLCRPVLRRWLSLAILTGRIPVPAPEELPKLMRARWAPQGWEYVQPETDVKAAVRRVRAGVSSRTREAAKLGHGDIEALDREIAAERTRATELGLVFESDAGSTRSTSAGSDGGTAPDQLTDAIKDAVADGEEDAA